MLPFPLPCLRLRNRFRVLLELPSIALLFAAALPTAAAHAADLAIAVAGDPAPDSGGGSYAFFGVPSINEAGEVALLGFLDGGSAASGVFVESESAGRKVALAGEVAPGTGGATYSGFFVFDPVLINDSSDVVFSASLTGGSATRGIFVESNGSLSALALLGDPAPGTGGGVYAAFSDLAINDAGQVAFVATIGSGSTTEGLFLDSLTDPAVAVALAGDATPGIAGGSFDSFQIATVDDAGAIGTLARIDTPAGASDAHFILSGGSGSLIARDGDPAPGTGGGSYDFFNVSPPATNGSGDVAFVMPIAGGTGGEGLFVERAGVQSAIALEDDPAPDGGGGTFSIFDAFPAIDEAGRVAFIADLAGGTTPNAVFLDSAGDLAAIAVAGNPAPGTGGGVYSEFALSPSINTSGDVAFAAFVTGGSSAGGIFVVPEPGTGMATVVGAGLLTLLRNRRRSIVAA